MELKEVVGKISPLLGAALGAFVPGGSLIVSGLAHLFGVDSSNSDQLAAAIASDPEAVVKIKQFEFEHKDALLTAATQVRLGAYDREAQVVKATGKRDWVMDFLAVFVTVGFFALCLMIKFTILDPSDKDLFYMLIGTFSSGWSIVLAYYFGATKSKSSVMQHPQAPDVVIPPPAQTR